MSGFEIPAQEVAPVALSSTTDTTVFVDPAVFIFANSKYHDCYVTVSDDAGASVEKFGVVSIYLITQSSVFRGILEDKKADLNNVTINNITPAIFKLMLVHMYGGKLPEVDNATMAQLALAAQLYNLRYLVEEACCRLVPTSVNDLFPALVCVAHFATPSLLPIVTKIIQENTVEVIKSEEFLKLDTKCLDFIASLEKLSIGEIELRKAIVRWAGHKGPSASNEKQVNNSAGCNGVNIIETDDKFVNACEEKETSKEALTVINKITTEIRSVVKIFTRDAIGPGLKAVVSSRRDSHSDLFTITPQKTIEIESLLLYGRSVPNCSEFEPLTFEFDCSILVSLIDDGVFKPFAILPELKILCACNREILVPLQLTDGSPLILRASFNYGFQISVCSPSGYYPNKYWIQEIGSQKNVHQLKFEDVNVKFYHNGSHLKGIGYKI